MTITLDQALPIAAARTERQRMVDKHFLGSPEQSFTGFSAAEIAGFTTQTATSMADLVAKISALGVNDEVAIELQWNGISSTGSTANGPSSGALTADGSVDWGYLRPGQKVYVTPAAGYSPICQGTQDTDNITLMGVSRVHFDGVTFQDTEVKLDQQAANPCLPIAAFTGCTFNGSGPQGGYALRSRAARALHVENCIFDGCRGNINQRWNYCRIWNTEFVNAQDNDIVGNREYDASYMSGWISHTWIAGCTVHNVSSGNAASGAHNDFFQFGHLNDAHAGYSQLIECNVVHWNRPETSYKSQGIAAFSYDGAGEWVIHNNIILVAGYWACLMRDGADNADKFCIKNTFARTGNGGDQNTYQAVTGSRVSSGAGSLLIQENYYAIGHTPTAITQSSNTTLTGNVDCDARSKSPSADAPDSLFLGTWSGTNSYGYDTYNTGESGLALSAARQAIIDQFKPAAGWGVNAGPEDPAQWPTDYENFTGSSLPQFGPSITINLTR